MTFPMTLDGFHRTLTAAVVAVVAAGVAVVFASALPAAPAFALLLAGAVFLAWAFAPTALELDDHELRVVRHLAPPVRVPLASLRALSRGGPAFSWRLFGVGGLFGSYGLYHARGLGTYRRYATHVGESLLLERTRGLPIAVTPDDEAGFECEVRARLPR